MKVGALTPLTVLAVLGVVAAGCQDPRVIEERRAAEQARLAAEEAPKPIPASDPLPAGSYPVQTVAYDDSTGNYRIFVLGAPAGTKPLYEHQDVQLARLTDEAIAAGEKTKIEFADGKPPVLHLTPDFSIEYVHNLTEERLNPATNQPEVVVVGQQTSTWSPFMSAMTGAMIGNMLFAPRYYYPPPYTAGRMTGYGGMGESRALASQSYAQKFGAPPKPVTLAKSGMAPRKLSDTMRTSGSGAGASRLNKNANKRFPRPTFPGRRGGFGGGRRR